jgi:protoheme IX farnesyltransferase
MKSQTISLTAPRTRSADFLALTKPRVNMLVAATTLAGYYLGAGTEGRLATLVAVVAGTALVSGGSAALNQIFEREADGRMRRTMRRPLPDGRLQAAEAAPFAAGLIGVGLAVLLLGTNLLAAGVALGTAVAYAFVYTPMKRRTPFAIVIGAVPGALPPMIGWAAARGTLDPAGWPLFGIVFLWQLPHFLAIAWMYRDDYKRGGFPMLPVVEPDGRSTARQAILYAAALVPMSLAPTVLGLAGTVYFAGALALSLAYLWLTLRFGFARTLSAARWLFVGSILYLPALWILMIANRA